MHRDPIIPLIAARKQCEAMLASSKSSWRKRVAAAFTRGRLERRLLRRRPITNEGALASLELILLTLKSYPDKDQGLQLISSLAVGVHSQFQRDASRTPKLAHNRRRKGSCPRAVQPKGAAKAERPLRSAAAPRTPQSRTSGYISNIIRIYFMLVVSSRWRSGGLEFGQDGRWWAR